MDQSVSKLSGKILLLLLPSLILASCGSSSVASPTTTSTIVASPTSNNQTCKSSQLSFSITNQGIGAGQFSALGVFKNRGQQSCTLDGFPKLQMIASTGQSIYTQEKFTSSNSSISGLAKPKPVVIKPGGFASFVVVMYDGNGSTNLPNPPCPTAHSVAVTLPGSSAGTSNLVATVPSGNGSFTAYPSSSASSIQLQTCGGIYVSPINPGKPGTGGYSTTTTGPTSSSPTTTTSPAKSPTLGAFSPVSFTAVSAKQFWLLGTINGCTKGSCFSILHTTDGGAHFAKIPSPSVQSLGLNPILRFATPLDGYLEGTSTGTWQTNNGGASWQKSQVAPSTTSNGYAYAVQGNFGTNKAVLMRSPIGTNSWKTVPLSLQSNFALYNIAARGPSLWITESDLTGTPQGSPQIIYSSDFGNHFTQVTSPCGIGTELVLKASSQSVLWADCASTISSQVYRSTNAGKNWNVISNIQGTFNIPAIIAPVNSSEAFWARGNTQIVRTTNGGASFSPVASGLAPRGSYWAWIGFTTPQVGSALMGTQQGVFQLWRTTDGGNTWKGPISLNG